MKNLGAQNRRFEVSFEKPDFLLGINSPSTNTFINHSFSRRIEQSPFLSNVFSQISMADWDDVLVLSGFDAERFFTLLCSFDVWTQGGVGLGNDNGNGPNPPTDLGEIAKRIAAGDRSAENLLVKTYEKPILFFLRRKFFDASFVPDAVQDAFFLTIIKLREGAIRNPDGIKSFLRTSAYRIGYSYLRKDKPDLITSDTDRTEVAIDPSMDIFSRISRDELIVLVHKIVDSLKVARDAEIIRQFYFFGSSKLEICSDLNLSPAHFDRVLYRAKQRLRSLIDDDPDIGPPIATAIVILLLSGGIPWKY